MIVISNPTGRMNEINIIHDLFEEGMNVFHIRKPNYSKEDLRFFIDKIQSNYHSQLVLHQHHELTKEFQMNRFHFTENNRLDTLSGYSKPDWYKSLSTSVHFIEDFNALSADFDYAFLSPIYPSISKENYVPIKDAFEEVKKRINTHTKLIALGGISPQNIQKTINNGFDDFALLGTIWNSTNPIENFKKCQKVVHSF